MDSWYDDENVLNLPNVGKKYAEQFKESRTAVKPSAADMYFAELRERNNQRFGFTMTKTRKSPTGGIDLMAYWIDILKKDEKDMNTNWEFHSSADADINWKDIKKSLTYAEPLAIVTRKYRDWTGEDKYIVVNKEFMDKVHTVGMLEDAPDIIATVQRRVYQIDNNFSEWVQWAKDVKSAPWPDGIKSTLNVVLPTI